MNTNTHSGHQAPQQPDEHFVDHKAFVLSTCARLVFEPDEVWYEGGRRMGSFGVTLYATKSWNDSFFRFSTIREACLFAARKASEGKSVGPVVLVRW
jgi:hypothetical protein